jgi:hypothetical protein
MLKFYLIRAFLIFLLTSACFSSSCTSENESGKERMQQNVLLQQQIDSLTAQIDSLQKQSGGLSELDVRFLERQGLQNPVPQLKADLLRNKQLISEKGSMGGTMQFYEDNIQILSRKWVRAYFEDGHHAGEMLLAYKVNKDGKIEWEVLDSEMK